MKVHFSEASLSTVLQNRIQQPDSHLNIFCNCDYSTLSEANGGKKKPAGQNDIGVKSNMIGVANPR